MYYATKAGRYYLPNAVRRPSLKYFFVHSSNKILRYLCVEGRKEKSELRSTTRWKQYYMHSGCFQCFQTTSYWKKLSHKHAHELAIMIFYLCVRAYKFGALGASSLEQLQRIFYNRLGVFQRLLIQYFLRGIM